MRKIHAAEYHRGLGQPHFGNHFTGDKPVTGPSNGRVMMFQSQSLFPWLTVIENIKFGLAISS